MVWRASAARSFPNPQLSCWPIRPIPIISAAEPPTFVVVGDQDGISPPSVMERRVNALRQMGTEVEYRIFAGVGHGFGLGIGT